MLIDKVESHKNATKHTLAVLVENKPGVLNRVSSLMRRRSFNIYSLAVGETEDPTVSRMTIVIDASKTNAQLVERNLLKLANVIDVRDVTGVPSVSRELALVKVRVTDAGKRGELKQIADMFQSRVVDVAKDSIMIEITGEETKVDSVLNVLHDYGIIEVVRTGHIAMVRG